MSGWPVGAAAALLFLMSPGAIIQAHTMKPHMFWAFLSIGTLFLSIRAHASGMRRDFLAAGAASGLAVGAAFNAWPSCLFVAAAAFLRAQEHPRSWKKEAVKLSQAAGASIAAFFVVNPYWILDFKRAYGEFAVISEFTALNIFNPFTLAWNPLRQSVTLPLLILMGLGLIHGLRSSSKRPALFLCAAAFLICLGAGISTAGVTSTRQIRYFLPLVGTGMLLASIFVADMASKSVVYRRAALALSCAVFVLIGTQGVLYAWNFKKTAGIYSNHHVAGAWIDKNIPAGASMGVLREPAPSNAPYFSFNRLQLRLIPPKTFTLLPEEQLPEYFVVTSPDYDDRPRLEPSLSQYYRVTARFDRLSLGWASIHPTATTANPLIEIYKKIGEPRGRI
jgi:hypothetical protein